MPPADWLWFDPPKSEYDSMVYYKAYSIPSTPHNIVPMRTSEKAFWLAFDMAYFLFIVVLLATALWQGIKD
jgi:hypothetical protein